MNLFQKTVIILNVKPFTTLFHAIYALGLKILLASLAKHPAIHAIFGCGSFFKGRCLYGLSDIDLIIIISAQYSRTDAEPYEIARLYKRIRRFFPFLGNWSEKAENIIFLSDVQVGFPVPESFSLRAKQGNLVLLHGEAWPPQFTGDAICVNEIVAEVNTLLRMTITKGEVFTSNLLFWKRIFSKIFALCKPLGLQALAQRFRREKALNFLNDTDLRLFIQKSQPEVLFPLLLNLIRQIFNAILLQEPLQSNTYISSNKINVAMKNAKEMPQKPDHLLTTFKDRVSIETYTLYAPVCGLLPRMNYFPIGEDAPVVEIKDPTYRSIRTLLKTLAQDNNNVQSLLILMGDFLFIASRLPAYVDVVPLDPIIFANIHARIHRQSAHFKMPTAMYKEQREIAKNMFRAFADIYKQHEGWVKKLPFPCLYIEDDITVVRDAFHRMRLFIIHQEGIDLSSPKSLITYLGITHPSCQSFFDDLLTYYRYLNGKAANSKNIAPNLYRCLHQFMAQFLTGASNISLADHHKRLGISVGIITRNRSVDLQEALTSLTQQIRPADEILIVDNGSTDPTPHVVESFKGQLPLSYHFLADASIPAARNMVLAKAHHDIVAYTDDDCIVDPAWLQAVERGFLRADNVGMVGGWVQHAPAAKLSVLDTYYSLFHHNKS